MLNVSEYETPECSRASVHVSGRGVDARAGCLEAVGAVSAAGSASLSFRDSGVVFSGTSNSAAIFE
jgi:hypothetical protein